MFVYCLFCRTQRCKRIAQLMEIRGVKRAFSPQILRKIRKQGENRKETADLLPGYVFLFNDEAMTDYQQFYGIDGVIRRVGRAEEWYELQGADREFALSLYEKDGVVGTMKLVEVGETVRLDDPLFNSSEGKITKIDYRKERARVDFKFDGNDCHTWVALDDIKKLEKKETL